MKKKFETYEIYPGGTLYGKIIISGPLPDADGIAVMTEAEYDQSFGRDFEHADHTDYDVTSGNGLVVLHPRYIPFDDYRVLRRLGIKKEDL